MSLVDDAFAKAPTATAVAPDAIVEYPNATELFPDTLENAPTATFALAVALAFVPIAMLSVADDVSELAPIAILPAAKACAFLPISTAFGSAAVYVVPSLCCTEPLFVITTCLVTAVAGAACDDIEATLSKIEAIKAAPLVFDFAVSLTAT